MYTIWLPFELVPNHDFILDEPVEFAVRGYPTRLVRQLGHVGLSLEGFLDEEAARAFLQTLNAALLYAVVGGGPSMRFEWEPVPVIYKEGDSLIYWQVSHFTSEPYPFNASRPAIHRSDKRLTEFAMTLGVRGRTPPDRFVENLQRGLGEPGLRDGIVYPAIKLGGDIYLNSQFEVSANATFLTLCTALEVLAPRSNRPDTVRMLVERWMREAQGLARTPHADVDERKNLLSLEGALRDLRKVSIRNAIKVYVHDTLSRDAKFRAHADEAAEKVGVLYRRRGSVIHGGATVDSEDLLEMDSIVRETLLAAMRSQ